MNVAVEGRPGRGRPRSERAREAVLAAATDLLVSGQIDAVTMEAIAARAGVSKSTIYKWWPSRAHVILESFFNRARYTMAIDTSASLQEVLTSQVLSLLRLFRDSDAGPLMADLMAASQADPDIRAALEEHWLRPRRQVSASLRGRGSSEASWIPGPRSAPRSTRSSPPCTTGCCSATSRWTTRSRPALVRQLLDGLRIRPGEDQVLRRRPALRCQLSRAAGYGARAPHGGHRPDAERDEREPGAEPGDADPAVTVVNDP